MVRLFRDPPVKVGASSCLACGRERGETRQAMTARLANRAVWLCVDCGDLAANRQAFIDAYAALRGLGAPGARRADGADRG